MKLPMREKYVDEAVGVWFVFGSRPDGTVDVSDGNRDVFSGIPADAAADLTKIQREFRERLYARLCRAQEPEATHAVLGVEGNAGFALLGRDLQVGVAEFCQVRDGFEKLHERRRRACAKALAQLRERLGRPDLPFVYGPSHPDCSAGSGGGQADV